MIGSPRFLHGSLLLVENRADCGHMVRVLVRERRWAACLPQAANRHGAGTSTPPGRRKAFLFSRANKLRGTIAQYGGRVDYPLQEARAKERSDKRSYTRKVYAGFLRLHVFPDGRASHSSAQTGAVEEWVAITRLRPFH
jgi:hypothetical protein